MNESEYLTDMEATEEYISENSIDSDSPPVTEILEWIMEASKPLKSNLWLEDYET